MNNVTKRLVTVAGGIAGFFLAKALGVGDLFMQLAIAAGTVILIMGGLSFTARVKSKP